MRILDLFIGIVLNLAIGYAAFRKNSVNSSGFLAGVLVGVSIYFFGGPVFWLLLGGFFVSSSLITRFKKAEKKQFDGIFEKTGTRDHLQVFANSITAVLLAVFYFITSDPVYLAGFVTAFAASNADTWASEIGTLSREDPISALTFKKVPRGTSGGISLLGLGASLAGSLFIAGLFFTAAVLIKGYSSVLAPVTILAAAGGFLGSVIDSILGATVQAQYLCTVTGAVTEKTHTKGKATLHIRGLRVINNDAVNLISITLTSSIVMALYTIFVL